MALDASGFEVLLVGPRVAHLAPYFERRRYKVSAYADGEEGADALENGDPDLVLLELNLGTFAASDFLALARGVRPRARYLLLDDPTKAGLVVKAIQAGADGYVATPPKEDLLFEEVERLLTTPRPSTAKGASKGAPLANAATKTLEKKLARAEADVLRLKKAADAAKAAPAPRNNDAALSALKKELEGATRKRKAAEDARDALKKTIEAQGKPPIGQALNAKRVKDLEEQILVLRAEMEAKEDTLGRESDEKNKLYRSNRDLQAELEAVKKARDDLNVRLEAQSALAPDSDEDGGQAAELQEQLREALRERDTVQAGHEELRRLLQETEANADQLEEQAERFKAQRRSVEQELKALRESTGDMSAVQSDLVKVRTELGEELAAHATRAENAEAGAAAANAAKEAAVAETESLRAALAAAKSELDDAAERADAGNTRADEFFQRAGAAEEKLEPLEQELETLRTDAKAAQEKAAAAEVRAADATERAEKAEADAAAATARADGEAAKVRAELQAEIDSADKRVADAEEKAIDKELEADDLASEITRLNELIKDGENNLKEAERAWRTEKLRLVEAQESAGSSDAYQKMEAMLDELNALRAYKKATDA